MLLHRMFFTQEVIYEGHDNRHKIFIARWIYQLMPVRAHLLIKGRVQGVWFRNNTQQEANNLGLKGWVKNLPDGQVEAVFEGEKNTVDKMIQWCHRGPRFARVDSIDVKWEKTKGNFDTFKILY